MNVGYHRKKEMFNLIELEIMKNLNHLIQTNNSIKVEKIEVVFRNVISRLIDEIKSHELVLVTLLGLPSKTY